MYTRVATRSRAARSRQLRRVGSAGNLLLVEDTPESRKEIAERIRRARLSAGYENTSEFARLVGVQPNTIYRAESGLNVPDIFTLEGISRVARVTIDSLIRGQEPSRGHKVLQEWLLTPRGASASEAAIAFLEALPLGGYTPTHGFYDLALFAYEQGLSGEDAALAARFTEAKKDR